MSQSKDDTHSSGAELQHDGQHWLLRPRMSEQPSRTRPGLVPALENSISILQYLNETAPHEASLAEIVAALGISKTHCHSILKTLVHFEWLRYDQRSRTYRLHSGIFTSASSLLNSPVMDTIRRHLTALVHKVDIPCLLTQPMNDDTYIVIDKFNGPTSMEISFPVGHRFPRDACAQMRAYLAWQSPDNVDTWFQNWQPTRYTAHSLLSEKDIRASIEATRRQGYAVSKGEFTDGIMAIALPIFDRDGKVTYVFNCSFMIDRFLPLETSVAKEMLVALRVIHRETLARPPATRPFIET
ncbi:IclR family transcriptional regulator [Brucella pseudogrignonensis]|uniref:IclR family transcriptional regulator n=1 Tax=Brucella pseudogrignonensis TaxID=419475 RepID=UPI003ED112A1